MVAHMCPAFASIVVRAGTGNASTSTGSQALLPRTHLPILHPAHPIHDHHDILHLNRRLATIVDPEWPHHRLHCWVCTQIRCGLQAAALSLYLMSHHLIYRCLLFTCSVPNRLPTLSRSSTPVLSLQPTYAYRLASLYHPPTYALVQDIFRVLYASLRAFEYIFYVFRFGLM